MTRMMPRNNPVRVPAHLLGEADPDTLAGLVSSSRRLGRHWPLLPGTSDPAPDGHGFRVAARAAALVARMPDYGD
jgi:hypothetical protein